MYADNHESTSEGRPLWGRWSKRTLIHHDLARAPIGLNAVPNQFVVPLVGRPQSDETPPGGPLLNADVITPTIITPLFYIPQTYSFSLTLPCLDIKVDCLPRFLLPKFSRVR